MKIIKKGNKLQEVGFRIIEEGTKIYYPREVMELKIKYLLERENRTKWMWGIIFLLIGVLLGMLIF